MERDEALATIEARARFLTDQDLRRVMDYLSLLAADERNEFGDDEDLAIGRTGAKLAAELVLREEQNGNSEK